MMKFYNALCLSFLALLTPALAQGEGAVTDATAVPEPSSAILAGVCGILFLLWRRK